MTLTTAEKNRVMTAAEHADKRNRFTCWLLEGGFLLGPPFEKHMPELRKKYTDFYVDNVDLYDDWASGFALNSRHERVMALLFFLEVNG